MTDKLRIGTQRVGGNHRQDRDIEAAVTVLETIGKQLAHGKPLTVAQCRLLFEYVTQDIIQRTLIKKQSGEFLSNKEQTAWFESGYRRVKAENKLFKEIK